MKYTSFGLLALLLTASLALASCAGADADGGEQGSGEQDDGSADRMQDMDHGGMTGMDHGPEGMRGMSMETVDPGTAGVSVELTSQPAAPFPGQPVTLSYRVTDTQSGRVLTDLPIDHERPMHLLVVSRDLEQFQHIHPEPGPDGSYSIETEFSDPGTYVLYDEFVRDGRRVLDRREFTVGEASDAEASLVPDLVPKTVDSVTVTLLAPETIRSGEEASFTFILTEGERSVADLEPYLGAAAHVAIVSADTEDFAHVHGEAGGDASEGHEGMGSMDDSPPSVFGPEVSFHHVFPRPGLYKIWAQFNREGNVITVPYVIEVR